MAKMIDRVICTLLLVAIAASYLMWIVGIDQPFTAYLYGHAGYLMIGLTAIALLLKVRSFTALDWGLIIGAGAIFLFYTFTSSMRGSNRFINATIPMIILIALLYQKITFSPFFRNALLVISLLAFAILLGRLLIEIHKIIPVAQLFKKSNQLEALWINTNTIGASLLFSTLMSAILLRTQRSLLLKWLLVPLYLAGLAGTWISQSQASFLALLGFVVVDVLIPKKWLSNKWLWLTGLTALLVVMPFVFYQLAYSSSVDLFTGRERIWAEFFKLWTANKQHVWIGMAPFFASWKPLGTHNSLIYVLNNFGIIGYLLFSGSLIFFFYQVFRNKTANRRLQIQCLLAFTFILIHSFMEDIMMAYHWLPIVYSFLGLALSLGNESEKDTTSA